MDTERLLRDVADGVIVLDRNGTIEELNPSFCHLLGLTRDYKGEKYPALMADTARAENDDFHQMLLEALNDRKSVHKKRIRFVLTDGTERTLDVTSSLLLSQDGEANEGVFLSISDATEEEKMRQKFYSSSQVFILLLIVVCLWIYVFSIWDYSGRGLPTYVMSKLLVLVALIPAIGTRHLLHLSYEDVGLGVRGCKKVIVTDSLLTLAGIVLLIVVKLFMMRFVPGFFTEGVPFFSFGKYPPLEYFTYALSVIGQEFISRGVVHECMSRVIPGKYYEVISIIVSSIMFGALHVHVGLVYMIGASILLGALGVIYRRQHTIWGLCIPHYILGLFIGILDFVVY